VVEDTPISHEDVAANLASDCPNGSAHEPAGRQAVLWLGPSNRQEANSEGGGGEDEEMTLRSEDSQTNRNRKKRLEDQLIAATPPRVHSVSPIYCVLLDIASDSRLNGRKEVLLANEGEESKAFELVLYRVFEFSEAQLDASIVQRLV